LSTVKPIGTQFDKKENRMRNLKKENLKKNNDSMPSKYTIFYHLFYVARWSPTTFFIFSFFEKENVRFTTPIQQLHTNPSHEGGFHTLGPTFM
jgi:hypothetical protein